MKIPRIIFLSILLIVLLIYFFCFSVRSPFKDYFFPLIYKDTADSIGTKTGDLENTHEVILRNGRKMNVRLLRETVDSYYLRGNFGHSGYVEHALKKTDIKSLEPLSIVDVPVAANEIITKRLLPDFHIYRRDVYTFFSDESYFYIERTVRLLEKLYQDLKEKFPEVLKEDLKSDRLCVAIFRNREDFKNFAQKLDPSLVNAAGFYHVDYETFFIYNMLPTGQVQDQTLDTIRHEGTHQIFYATGQHFGFSIDRLWLVEGLAVYCEPYKVGTLVLERMEETKKAMRSKDFIPLRKLLTRRFGLNILNKREIRLFYTESWALVYFLIRKHRTEFGNYLKELKDHPILCFFDGDAKLLEKSLGMNLQTLEDEFKSYWLR